MTAALTLPARTTTLTLFPRVFSLTLPTRQGYSLPGRIRLEDDSGYWLFEDGARFLTEAGDVGVPLTLYTRTLGLTL